MVCNYCHDPSTQIVATSVRTGSMKNYHSSTDSEVCTCCHRSSNNANFNLPAEPATPIIPTTQCGGSWPLVYPTWDPSTQAFTGGQFFGGN